jgi:hypothetical protein
MKQLMNASLYNRGLVKVDFDLLLDFHSKHKNFPYGLDESTFDILLEVVTYTENVELSK